MIINAYIPSFSLMLTTILPLYLKESVHFGTTITLVLTSLLCSFTLFQSSLSGIPKTSYLKFIDYWNLLALTVTLVNFFTLAVWEIKQHKGSHGFWLLFKTINHESYHPSCDSDCCGNLLDFSCDVISQLFQLKERRKQSSLKFYMYSHAHI